MGAGVGVLEVVAPPVGGTTPPLEGPAPPAGGPGSVFGSGGVRPVVSRTNDAARQALTAGAMLVLAGRGSGSVRDQPAASPHWHGPFSSRRADRRDRLLLGSHGDEELLGQLLDQILTIAPPSWRAKDVGVERNLWDHKNPYYGCRGAGLQEEQD